MPHTYQEKTAAAEELMRMLPPQKVGEHLNYIKCITKEDPNAEEDESVQDFIDENIKVPFEERECEVTGRKYLCGDYNRDEMSYRSPHSNEFQPFLKSSEYRPSEKLRELEIAMNTCYDEYARVYYGNEAISSCYIYDLEKDSVTGHEGFWGFLLIKKNSKNEAGEGVGCWDSVSKFRCEYNPKTEMAAYELETTIMLKLTQSQKNVNLSGALTRIRPSRNNVKYYKDRDHIINIGRMIDSAECSMREDLIEIYFKKTKIGVNACRSVTPMKDEEDKQKARSSTNSMLEYLREAKKIKDRKTIVRNNRLTKEQDDQGTSKM